jgi:dTDP-4-amino-4,6-dideoxygalactose transaminase
MTLRAINDLRRHTGSVEAEVREAVSRVIASGWFVLGPEVEGFEREFAVYCGAAHCVSLANGTDALELALRAVGIAAGSSVLTVANAGMYGTAAILATGARPIYIDIDERTLLADQASLEEAVGRARRVDAVILTHLYGLAGPTARLAEVARGAGLPVIEDCAQAHGALVDGRRAGTLGTVGCFSFYPTKNLGALGDGGAVVTSDPGVATAIRQLRQYGWSEKYVATRAHGRNSRLDEMQAAVLRAKLPHLDGWNRRRREIAGRYSQEIRHSGVRCPTPAGEDHVAHLYVVRTADRNGFRTHLAQRGVPSDIHYPVPDYRQPSIAGHFTEVSLARTEAACDQVVTLPCFPEMSDDEVAAVVSAVNAWRA